MLNFWVLSIIIHAYMRCLNGPNSTAPRSRTVGQSRGQGFLCLQPATGSVMAASASSAQRWHSWWAELCEQISSMWGTGSSSNPWIFNKKKIKCAFKSSAHCRFSVQVHDTGRFHRLSCWHEEQQQSPYLSAEFEHSFLGQCLKITMEFCSLGHSGILHFLWRMTSWLYLIYLAFVRIRVERDRSNYSCFCNADSKLKEKKVCS